MTDKQKISTILNSFTNGQLNTNGYLIRQSGLEKIEFTDINFDDSFLWNDDNALSLGTNNIDGIVVTKFFRVKKHINTYRNLPSLKKVKFFKSSISAVQYMHSFIIFSKKFTRIKQITFTNCSFNYMPTIVDSRIWKIEFNNCTFLDGRDVIPNLLEQSNENKKVFFIDCIWDDFHIGDIRHIQYNSDVKTCYFELVGGIIEDLTIENIEMASKFYINKQYSGNHKVTKITNLIIENAIFKENFKLHNCQVENVIVQDSDFEKHADFYKSEFQQGLSTEDDRTIYFKALNFKGLALFGDCTFNERLRFEYVTFENFSHFRRAKFMNGLDLDYTNIQKEMNFFSIEGLDTEKSKNNTSQETYRIIKHNFNKIGNVIEGNKYHALELDCHRKKTWMERDVTPELLSDGIVSFLHWLSSNNSRYWFLPLLWILVVGFITSNILGDTGIIKYATITKYDFMDKHPMVFLFNKATLGYLYYQFIISIRKNTRN